MLPQPQERAPSLDVEFRRASIRRTLRHIGALAVQALVLVGLLSLFFLRVPQVDGHSMAPQIDAGDHVVIDTVAYDLRIDHPGNGDGPLVDVPLRPVTRGDVIAFVHGSGDERRIYLKRVIGLPGDSVSIERGVVAVDGNTLVEHYDPLSDASDMAPVKVPAAELLVLGDNRGDSDDSRSFGPIPAGAVIGRAAFIVWPPNRVRSIR